MAANEELQIGLIQGPKDRHWSTQSQQKEFRRIYEALNDYRLDAKAVEPRTVQLNASTIIFMGDFFIDLTKVDSTKITTALTMWFHDSVGRKVTIRARDIELVSTSLQDTTQALDKIIALSKPPRLIK